MSSNPALNSLSSISGLQLQPDQLQTPSSQSIPKSPLISEAKIVRSPVTSEAKIVRSPITSEAKIVRSPVTSEAKILRSPITSEAKIVRSPITSEAKILRSPITSEAKIVRSPITSETKIDRGRRHVQVEEDSITKPKKESVVEHAPVSTPKKDKAAAALDDLLLDKKKALEQSDKRRKSVTGTDPSKITAEDIIDEFEEVDKESGPKKQRRAVLYRCLIFINTINFCVVFAAVMKRSIYYMPLERFWNLHFHTCQNHEMKRADDDTWTWFLLELYNLFLYGFCSLFMMWCGPRRTLDFIFLYFKLHIVASFANSFVGWQHIRLNGANWEIVKSEISWVTLQIFWDIFVSMLYIIYCYYLTEFETIWVRQIPMRSTREMNSEIDLKFLEDINVMKNAFKWSGRHQAIDHVRKFTKKYGKPVPEKSDKIFYDLDEGVYEFRQHHRVPHLRIHRAATGAELMKERERLFKNEEQGNVIQKTNKPIFKTKKRSGRTRKLKPYTPQRSAGMTRMHAELLKSKNPELEIEELMKQEPHKRLNKKR